MSFNCEILADSISPQEHRITTMKITFPRFILAEFNTHRMFSRNSASSRAIPFSKMVKMVEENPFIPIAWQKDHKGMQGTEYYTNQDDIDRCKSAWDYARYHAIGAAKSLNALGSTKQLCNRLLEPFMWHTVIVTSTEWENFFKLRCPQYSLFYEQIPMEFRSKKHLLSFVEKVEAPEFKDSYKNLTDLDWLSFNKGQAEIHIQAIAELMWDAMNESTPKQLEAGEWHIPFGNNVNLTETQKYFGEDSYKIKIATARCARVSYTVVGEEGKEPNYENDIKLHDRLAQSSHWSPFEHCARAMGYDEYNRFVNGKQFQDIHNPDIYGWCRNYRGFIQYRSLIDKV